MEKTSNLADIKIHTRFKLSACWASLTLCYLYGDYFGLFRPGSLQSMLDGQMGPLGATTENVLLGTSILMVIPCLMVLLSLILNLTATRWCNIIFGIFYTLIMLISMPGAWNFYIFLGLVEMAITMSAVWLAWNWPKRENLA